MRPNKRPAATQVREGTRACPSCGVIESRWVVGSTDYVNLSPITGHCVDCLVVMKKELGPLMWERKWIAGAWR